MKRKGNFNVKQPKYVPRRWEIIAITYKKMENDKVHKVASITTAYKVLHGRKVKLGVYKT